MLIDVNQIDLRQDDDGVWIAKSPLVPGCHAWGSTEIEAIIRFENALKEHLEALRDAGLPIPVAFRPKFVLVA